MSDVQTLVFDRNGYEIAEIEPQFDSICWRLNAHGLAHVRLPYTNAKCTKDILRSGNRVLFRFSNGLPNWGGVMDLERNRDGSGAQIACYSGEWILDWRVTGKNRVFSATYPGNIFSTLISEMNGNADTGITIGDIYAGGAARSEEYHYFDMQHQMTQLAENSGQDWAILPVYSAGRLTFRAYWYERRGADKTGQVWLIEGWNCSEATLSEQGRIANRYYVVGPGSTWGTERAVGQADDADSVAEYGFRERSEVASGQASQATLDATAAARLATVAWPQAMISLPKVNNIEPALFSTYDVGDILRAQLFLKAPEWAFDGDVRVMAREWKPDGTCSLEVTQWLG
jgi:hypothetical protein